MEIENEHKNAIEFLNKHKEKAPAVYFVDFAHAVTKRFYRHMGFYYTLEEAITEGKRKIIKKFNFEDAHILYNSNLLINTEVFFEKLIEKISQEEKEVDPKKLLNKKMKELIEKGDPKLAEEADLKDYQKKYILEKINGQKRLRGI